VQTIKQQKVINDDRVPLSESAKFYTLDRDDCENRTLYT
jgi:hypothetical protein